MSEFSFGPYKGPSLEWAYLGLLDRHRRQEPFLVTHKTYAKSSTFVKWIILFRNPGFCRKPHEILDLEGVSVG
jgi:hypothetical protein